MTMSGNRGKVAKRSVPCSPEARLEETLRFQIIPDWRRGTECPSGSDAECQYNESHALNEKEHAEYQRHASAAAIGEPHCSGSTLIRYSACRSRLCLWSPLASLASCSMPWHDVSDRSRAYSAARVDKGRTEVPSARAKYAKPGFPRIACAYATFF